MPPTYELRAFDEPAFRLSRAWLANPRLRALTGAPEIGEDEATDWFLSLPGRDDFAIFAFCIDGVPRGSCGFRRIDPVAGRAEYFGQIGEEAFWGLGHGRAMVELCEDWARRRGLAESYLWVDRANDRAIRLYRRLGYAEDGSDEARLRMSKALAAPAVAGATATAGGDPS